MVDRAGITYLPSDLWIKILVWQCTVSFFLVAALTATRKGALYCEAFVARGVLHLKDIQAWSDE